MTALIQMYLQMCLSKLNLMRQSINSERLLTKLITDQTKKDRLHMVILRQTAGKVIDPVMADCLVFPINCMAVSRSSD